ncbi:hypothetical protein C8J57DRAFT_1214094 [Mycena rebaudengoi]|nr:hypothetical protein C8J57DRAFT_1214094 [Mycena rebaudengoi]
MFVPEYPMSRTLKYGTRVAGLSLVSTAKRHFGGYNQTRAFDAQLLADPESQEITRTGRLCSSIGSPRICNDSPSSPASKTAAQGIGPIIVCPMTAELVEVNLEEVGTPAYPLIPFPSISRQRAGFSSWRTAPSAWRVGRGREMSRCGRGTRQVDKGQVESGGKCHHSRSAAGAHAGFRAHAQITSKVKRFVPTASHSPPRPPGNPAPTSSIHSCFRPRRHQRPPPTATTTKWMSSSRTPFASTTSSSVYPRRTSCAFPATTNSSQDDDIVAPHPYDIHRPVDRYGSPPRPAPPSQRARRGSLQQRISDRALVPSQRRPCAGWGAKTPGLRRPLPDLIPVDTGMDLRRASSRTRRRPSSCVSALAATPHLPLLRHQTRAIAGTHRSWRRAAPRIVGNALLASRGLVARESCGAYVAKYTQERLWRSADEVVRAGGGTSMVRPGGRGGSEVGAAVVWRVRLGCERTSCTGDIGKGCRRRRSDRRRWGTRMLGSGDDARSANRVGAVCAERQRTARDVTDAALGQVAVFPEKDGAENANRRVGPSATGKNQYSFLRATSAAVQIAEKTDSQNKKRGRSRGFGTRTGTGVAAIIPSSGESLQVESEECLRESDRDVSAEVVTCDLMALRAGSLLKVTGV